MSSVIRFSQVNGGGAVLTSAFVDTGDELADVIVKRVFTAADIGTGTGQTQDTTSNPTLGCLVAQFQGSRIIDVELTGPWRPATATHVTIFNHINYGTGANTANVGWNVVYNKNLGVSSVYILDTAAGAPGLIVAADFLYVHVRLGHSSTLPVLG